MVSTMKNKPSFHNAHEGVLRLGMKRLNTGEPDRAERIPRSQTGLKLTKLHTGKKAGVRVGHTVTCIFFCEAFNDRSVSLCMGEWQKVC